MSDEFSTKTPVKPNKGKAQWVKAEYVNTKTNKDERLHTHNMTVPYLMPGTTLFVHGVNSDGEWYKDAADQFCAGLNKRLGRKDLDSGEFIREKMRFTGRDKEGQQRARSPIIPFYWGYKMQPGDDKSYPGIYHKADKSWGGGPFQNGTNSLLQFWQRGFKRRLLGGILDLEAINPEIDRQLQDAPPRSYYIHAAKRLANLIDTIRTDFPDEPLNVVAHSQGCLVSLCAMLYVKKRAPDTLMINSAPYSFGTQFTDSLTAAGSDADVQSEEARFNTFKAIAEKIAKAKTEYQQGAEKNAACASDDGKGCTVMYTHHEPERAVWQGQIGTGKINAQGGKWHEDDLTSRDNRGKLFVNFNPHDRVIGVSAVEGIGWRGIPKEILDKLPGNVYQRVFVRNSGVKVFNDLNDLPAVGGKQGYWFNFFIEDVVYESAPDNSSLPRPPTYKTFDGKKESEFWDPAPNKAAGIINVQGTPGKRERVWINAPVVPVPAILKVDFDQGMIQFDGLQSGKESEEQQEDFENFKQFYVKATITEPGHGPHGQPVRREETDAEVFARLSKYAKLKVNQTDHGQILRYGSDKKRDSARPVEQVLSYDLTVGQGYAFGDADYWQYLLDLADWKVSDPFYRNESTTIVPGSYPTGLDSTTRARPTYERLGSTSDSALDGGWAATTTKKTNP